MCASAHCAVKMSVQSHDVLEMNIYTVRALLTPQAECIYSPLRLTKINALFYCAACALQHILRALHLSLCYSWASLSVCCTAAAPLIYARRSCFIRNNRKQTGCFGKPLNWKWEAELHICLKGYGWMNKHQLHCSITSEMTCKKCSLYMSTRKLSKNINCQSYKP